MHYTHLSWRQFERTKRNRYQMLLTYHQVEIYAFECRIASEIYFRFP